MVPRKGLSGKDHSDSEKERPVDFGDYRPICVMPLVVRILHRVLAKRMNKVKHHAFQAGFVEGRSTSENVWLLNAVLGSAGTCGTSAYASLLDFKKAFDSVKHNALIGILQDLGLPPHFVEYIRMVYTHTLLTLGDDWFQQGRGVPKETPSHPIFLTF